MNNQRWPGPDPDPDLDMIAHLSVDVRPTSRNSRWAWELIDNRDGSVVESEFDFESPMAARRAALARLDELTPSLPEATATARATGAPRSDHLVIVSRREDTLYGVLKRLFADSGGVTVIRDRRHSLPGSRHSRDRRARHPDAVERARGWWIVCRSDTAPTARLYQESA